MIVIKNSALRGFIRRFVPWVLIPGALVAGALLPDDQQYWLAALVIAVLSVVLFISGFEKKKTGSRRLVTVSVMSALAVVGRFIPFFKPVSALVILTGAYFGPEAGFLCGSSAALVSNFFFGQGPWTPFQMAAWGMIGLLSGYMSRPLLKSRALLILWGALAGAMFSMIMDVWTVLWYARGLRADLYLEALWTSLTHLILYSVSNVGFLILLARPIGEKLSRLKTKYRV